MWIYHGNQSIWPICHITCISHQLPSKILRLTIMNGKYDKQHAIENNLPRYWHFTTGIFEPYTAPTEQKWELKCSAILVWFWTIESPTLTSPIPFFFLERPLLTKSFIKFQVIFTLFMTFTLQFLFLPYNCSLNCNFLLSLYLFITFNLNHIT